MWRINSNKFYHMYNNSMCLLFQRKNEKDKVFYSIYNNVSIYQFQNE